jgi:hypothetical protein
VPDDCAHHFHLDTVEPIEGGQARKVTLTCDTCGTTFSKITAKTDAEITAELDAQ